MRLFESPQNRAVLVHPFLPSSALLLFMTIVYVEVSVASLCTTDPSHPFVRVSLISFRYGNLPWRPSETSPFLQRPNGPSLVYLKRTPGGSQPPSRSGPLRPGFDTYFPPPMVNSSGCGDHPRISSSIFLVTI